MTLAIELKSERKLIGAIRLAIVDRENRTGDFGYVLNRRYWNERYTTEAAYEVLRRGFSLLQLHRIWATCDTRNVASARVMEHIGMRREGCFVRDVLQRGEWRDSYLYALLENEAR